MDLSVVYECRGMRLNKEDYETDYYDALEKKVKLAVEK